MWSAQRWNTRERGSRKRRLRSTIATGGAAALLLHFLACGPSEPNELSNNLEKAAQAARTPVSLPVDSTSCADDVGELRALLSARDAQLDELLDLLGETADAIAELDEEVQSARSELVRLKTRSAPVRVVPSAFRSASRAGERTGSFAGTTSPLGERFSPSDFAHHRLLSKVRARIGRPRSASFRPQDGRREDARSAFDRRIPARDVSNDPGFADASSGRSVTNVGDNPTEALARADRFSDDDSLVEAGLDPEQAEPSGPSLEERNPDETPPETPPLFDKDGLVEAGVDSAQVDWLAQRFQQSELEHLNLMDQAAREGWPKEHRGLANLERIRQLENELGSDSYDLMLYGAGRTNRLAVQHVLSGSAAESVGLESGDIVVSYAGRRILNNFDLQAATTAGELGETVDVEVVRAGDSLRLTIPRGPLGATFEAKRLLPEIRP